MPIIGFLLGVFGLSEPLSEPLIDVDVNVEISVTAPGLEKLGLMEFTGDVDGLFMGD